MTRSRSGWSLNRSAPCASPRTPRCWPPHSTCCRASATPRSSAPRPSTTCASARPSPPRGAADPSPWMPPTAPAKRSGRHLHLGERGDVSASCLFRLWQTEDVNRKCIGNLRQAKNRCICKKKVKLCLTYLCLCFISFPSNFHINGI